MVPHEDRYGEFTMIYIPARGLWISDEVSLPG